MICPNCGREANGNFCPGCGTRLAAGPTMPPANNPNVYSNQAYAQNQGPAQNLNAAQYSPMILHTKERNQAMAMYKCVPGPGVLTIKKLKELDNAVALYGDIISRETVGGWDLDGIYPIQITKKAGLFSSMVGLSDDNYELNMLVFKKE